MWKGRRRRLCRLLILSIYLKRDSLPLAPSERHKKKVEQRERGKEDTEAIGFYTHFSRLDTRGKRKERKKEEQGKSEMALLYLVFVSEAQVWAAAAGGKSGEELK